MYTADLLMAYILDFISELFVCRTIGSLLISSFYFLLWTVTAEATSCSEKKYVNSSKPYLTQPFLTKQYCSENISENNTETPNTRFIYNEKANKNNTFKLLTCRLWSEELIKPDPEEESQEPAEPWPD